MSDNYPRPHTSAGAENIKITQKNPWQTSSDGSAETRLTLGRSEQGHHFAIELSQYGGDPIATAWSRPFGSEQEAQTIGILREKTELSDTLQNPRQQRTMDDNYPRTQTHDDRVAAYDVERPRAVTQQQRDAGRSQSDAVPQPRASDLSREAYDLIRTTRSELVGMGSASQEFWGDKTYSRMSGEAKAFVEHMWDNKEAAGYMKAAGNSREAMRSSLGEGNYGEALKRFPDLPMDQAKASGAERIVSQGQRDEARQQKSPVTMQSDIQASQRQQQAQQPSQGITR